MVLMLKTSREVKNRLLEMLIDGLESVDYCDVFISSHSDGTHSLQSIHWLASDEMLHFSKSDEEKNSS